MLIFLLSSRILLSNRIVADLTYENRLSKKEGAWYYVKCPKNQNCSKIIQQNFYSKDLSILKNDAFTVYLTKTDSSMLNKLKLKYSKIPKSHKILNHISQEMSSTYIVFATNSCEIPFSPKKITNNFYLFDTNLSYENVLSKINKINCIRSFERLPKSRLNAKYLSANDDDVEFSKDTQILKHILPMYNRLIKHGIAGDGQVASIVDSGVNDKLCWFFDPERPLELNSVTDHRKIKAYFPEYSDRSFSSSLNKDQRDHGTFIAGLISGNALCDLYDNYQCPGTYFNGVAPNSRLIVTEILKSDMENMYTNNFVNAFSDQKNPKNIYNLFSIPQTLSASVQYHGFDFKDSSMFTSLIDSIAYNNPKMLFVFAAGDIENSTNIISSPGDSKNVLTVGATSMDQSIISEIDQNVPVIVVNNGREYVGYCDIFHGISYFRYLALNNYLHNENNRLFKIGENVLIEKEEKFNRQLVNSKKFEVLLVFHDNEFDFKIQKPVIRLPATLLNSFNKGDDIEFRIFSDFDSQFSITNNKKAKYSREDSPYFKHKPDIYMPGGPVYGPNSGILDKCGIEGVRIGEGTSVSAAFATGTVLLLKQYISEGHYHRIANSSFTPNLNVPISSSSHTIRSILANVNDENGSPHIGNFCIFKDDYNIKNGGIRYFAESLKSNTHSCYSFRAQFDGNLKVTIAWNDPPSDPFAPSNVLFKVDVRIEAENGTFFGNLHYDPFNTVKINQVSVKKDEKYKILVICGDNLFFDPMEYTIVISGPFDHFDNSFVNKLSTKEEEKGDKSVKCVQRCAPKSKCVNGFCVCAENQYGEKCDKQLIQMVNYQTEKDIVLQPYDSVFFSYVFKQWKPGSKLSIEFDQNISSLFFMFSINNLPNWDSANCNSESCQWATKANNKLTLEYHLWDFVQNGDKLHFVVYSFDSKPVKFSITLVHLFT